MTGSRAGAETRARVTTPAILEIQIAAKGPPPVVTGRARTAAHRKVFLRARRTHLPALGETRSLFVTVCAVESLTRAMFCVTEADSIRGGVSRCARVRLRRMTDAARAEITTVGLRIGRMTGVATGMRIQSRWYRQAGAAT